MTSVPSKIKYETTWEARQMAIYKCGQGVTKNPPRGGGGVPAYLGFIGMWPFRGYGFNKSKQFSLGIQIREFRP